MSKKIKIESPATIANLVCGYDVLGLALSHPADYMEMKLLPEKKVVIKHTDSFGLPEDPEKNVAGAALLSLLNDIDRSIGFEVLIEKRIKPGSGLGSSAASAAGAIAGANYLLENTLSPKQMIQYAMNGEKLASGVKHADNIAPCILGGITLIRSILPLDIVKLPYPDLYITAVHPQLEVKTSDARAILKKSILLKDAVKQWGNIAGLVAGLYEKDYTLISRSLQDIIVEPIRSILIPGLSAIKERVKSTRALGGGISGSGPSIFMLSKTLEDAREVEYIMKDVYTRLVVEHITYISTIGKKGILIEEVR